MGVSRHSPIRQHGQHIPYMTRLSRPYSPVTPSLFSFPPFPLIKSNPLLTSSISVREIRESPDISQADSISYAWQEEVELISPVAPFLILIPAIDLYLLKVSLYAVHWKENRKKKVLLTLYCAVKEIQRINLPWRPSCRHVSCVWRESYCTSGFFVAKPAKQFHRACVTLVDTNLTSVYCCKGMHQSKTNVH